MTITRAQVEANKNWTLLNEGEADVRTLTYINKVEGLTVTFTCGLGYRYEEEVEKFYV